MSSRFTVEHDVDIDDVPEHLLEEWADENGYVLEEHVSPKGSYFYPHNDIRTVNAYTTLLDNLDKVPVEEIEKLVTKYGL